MSRILIIDDEPAIGWTLGELLTDEGHSVEVAASVEQGLESCGHRPPEAMLLDVRLPGRDGIAAIPEFRALAPEAAVVVMTAFGDLDTAVRAVNAGACDYLVKPFDLESVSRVVAHALADRRRPREDHPGTAAAADAGTLVGTSPAMQQVFKQISLAAPTDLPVLIEGETGTGKELVARAIHAHGPRHRGPFVATSLAALAAGVIESELFGHVRGAFTGASGDRPGLLASAAGGTIFLDEIGDAPLDIQVKLLRALENRESTAVGATKTQPLDVRVIAATNRDLKQEVRRGRFREDLYFRLNVFPVESVPLRERRDDIPLLAAHFLEAAGRKLRVDGIRLTEGNVRQLAAYSWPGNVRELENVIERAVILARDGRMRFDLPDSGARLATPQQAAAPAGRILTEDDRRSRDRQNIEAALKASGGRVYGAGGAAELLGIKPTTLASRIKALGIAVPA